MFCVVVTSQQGIFLENSRAIGTFEPVGRNTEPFGFGIDGFVILQMLAEQVPLSYVQGASMMSANFDFDTTNFACDISIV